MTAARNSGDRANLQLLFPDLAAVPESHYLALRRYLHHCPERFFERNVHRLMLDWLKRRDAQQRAELRDFFASVSAELSAAILFLRQINSEDWHDGPLVNGEDYEVLRFVDKVLHPAYLRLAEAVLAPLIRPVAHFSRLDRGKGTEGLDVFNLVQELAGTPMAPCVAAYSHLVRNGVGHGGITYLLREIRYRDKKGNEEVLDVWSVVRLCDDLIDTCNGLASAIKVFLVLSLGHGYHFPLELLVEELIEETRSPWWSINGCIESELRGGTQLLIYGCPNSRDVLKIQWAAVQSAILAESLAPGYCRYFFSLRGPMSRTGWAAFDGNKLRQFRESGASEVHEYAGALEEAGIFYAPRPALPRPLARMETLIWSFRLQSPLFLRTVRENLRIPSVTCRDAQMHRIAWGNVLRGSVIIGRLANKTAAEIIRSNRRRIIRTAARAARSSLSWMHPARFLPLAYARISVFSDDYRRRRLGSFGLGPELVCTIQFQRIRSIRSPDIMGSTVETSGNWRIAWNKAWLESGGTIQAAPQPG